MNKLPYVMHISRNSDSDISVLSCVLCVMYCSGGRILISSESAIHVTTTNKHTSHVSRCYQRAPPGLNTSPPSSAPGDRWEDSQSESGIVSIWPIRGQMAQGLLMMGAAPVTCSWHWHDGWGHVTRAWQRVTNMSWRYQIRPQWLWAEGRNLGGN